MEDEVTAKVLQLLDVISVEVAANRNETSELRSEMRSGFGRVERRLGNIEVRVETVETDLRSFRGEFERRIVPLER
jgi:hypothetical protein